MQIANKDIQKNHSPQFRYMNFQILYHVTENTANQNVGKPLYIRQYSTDPFHRSVQLNCVTTNLAIWPLYFLGHSKK